MSTILKALRRLERERAQPDRTLREQVTGPGSSGRGDGRAPRRWPILLGGVGAGVLAGLAVLFLAFSRGKPVEEIAPGPAARAAAPEPTRAQPPPPQGRVAPAPLAAAAPHLPARARAVEVPAPEPPLEDVAVVDRGTPGPRVVAEAAAAPSPEAALPKPGSLRPMQRLDLRGLSGHH